MRVAWEGGAGAKRTFGPQTRVRSLATGRRRWAGPQPERGDRSLGSRAEQCARTGTGTLQERRSSATAGNSHLGGRGRARAKARARARAWVGAAPLPSPCASSWRAPAELSEEPRRSSVLRRRWGCGSGLLIVAACSRCGVDGALAAHLFCNDKGVAAEHDRDMMMPARGGRDLNRQDARAPSLFHTQCLPSSRARPPPRAGAYPRLGTKRPLAPANPLPPAHIDPL